jgi:hypothetical protein
MIKLTFCNAHHHVIFAEIDIEKAVSQVAAKGVGNIYVTAKTYVSLPFYFPKEVEIANSTALQ